MLINQALNYFPDEVYPGQKNEILSMFNAHGCDINEHVPTLIEYGLKVTSITEMGVRFGWSTRSFLYARPMRLLSIDKYPWGSIEQAGGNPQPKNFYFEHYKQLYRNIVDFQFILSDTTKMQPIPLTELLFIDTFHHRDCLQKELELHGNQAMKYILLHDTTTFGLRGQADDSLIFIDHVTTNEPGTGLITAIQDFLHKNPHWHVHQVFLQNNGLTVLQRD